MLERTGSELVEEWRCPFDERGRFSAPHAGDRRYLSPGCRGALERVESMTGAEGFETCPRWYVEQPHVVEIINARWHAGNGELAIDDPFPSWAKLDAIHALVQGENERAALEWKEHQERLAQLSKGGNRGGDG